MTCARTLNRARQILTAADIEDPALESELLLRHALGLDRVQLYQQPERKLSPEEDKLFWSLIERRLNHEPTAYIIGHREFYGYDFNVTQDVMIPRPESELLVEKALFLAERDNLLTIADVGTGCGAIAICLALNLPEALIYALDISKKAIAVALSNCQKHGVGHRVRLMSGDMLDPLPAPVDLIVANLPYVRQSDLAGVDTKDFEPVVALDGGPDGLDKIRRLCIGAGDKLNPGGSILLEIGLGQAEAVTALLHHLFPLAKLEAFKDLSGIDRVVSLTLDNTE